MATPMASDREWTIWGISELSCWLLHPCNPVFGSPSGHDAEDCLAAHLASGIRHVHWDLGRSVLTYHSDLPNATCPGKPRQILTSPGKSAHRAVDAMVQDRCPLRAALRFAKANQMVLYGWLTANRHYAPGTALQSDFATFHPHWHEGKQNGWLDSSRLCYAIPEVRQERIDILLEVAGLGVDGLMLDFCRQPPLVGYHPALVNPYRQQFGRDPLALTPAQPEDYLHWCAWRTECLTTLLREVKARLTPFRERYQKRLPFQVRVPNDGFAANLTAGIDIVTWCREGLIDELSLSELRWQNDFAAWDDAPYIALGRQYGIPVYGSSNALPRQANGWGGEVNPRGLNPLVLARRALRSHAQGASGIAFYQSDTGIQIPEVQNVVAMFKDPDALRKYTEDDDVRKRWPVTPENADYGIDNHSRWF